MICSTKCHAWLQVARSGNHPGSGEVAKTQKSMQSPSVGKPGYLPGELSQRSRRLGRAQGQEASWVRYPGDQTRERSGSQNVRPNLGSMGKMDQVPEKSVRQQPKYKDKLYCQDTSFFGSKVYIGWGEGSADHSNGRDWVCG